MCCRGEYENVYDYYGGDIRKLMCVMFYVVDFMFICYCGECG